MTVFANGLKTALLLGLMIGLCLGVGEIAGGERGMIFGFASAALAIISYFFSDKIALMSVGARPLAREEHEQLYEIVERLSQRAGIPMPKLVLVARARGPTPSPQAAIRAMPVVCVTDGALRLMNDKEMAGVLGARAFARETSGYSD